jgi:hypothetical protein
VVEVNPKDTRSNVHLFFVWKEGHILSNINIWNNYGIEPGLHMGFIYVFSTNHFHLTRMKFLMDKCINQQGQAPMLSQVGHA